MDGWQDLNSIRLVPKSSALFTATRNCGAVSYLLATLPSLLSFRIKRSWVPWEKMPRIPVSPIDDIRDSKRLGKRQDEKATDHKTAILRVAYTNHSYLLKFGNGI